MGPELVGTLFLRDVDHGGDPGQPAAVAAALAGFIGSAVVSVDVAIYDFRLSDSLAGPVVGALVDAAARGVRVRVAYDAGKPATGDAAAFAALEADPAPPGTAGWVTEHFAGTAVLTRPVHAAPQLMHSKYVVRDAPTTPTDPAPTDPAPTGLSVHAPAPGGGAAVWTGSTNFTDDAWTHQENNVVTVADPGVAAAYAADFTGLWEAGAITGTGRGDTGTTTVGDGLVGWDFAPGDGPGIDAALTAAVAAARDGVQVAAMVLTSHGLLGALAAAIGRGVPVGGVYDAGQMDPIVAGWRANPNDAQVLADFTTVAGRLSAKHSTPYTPDGVHDFMHDKILITDRKVWTGSYNFSANAQRNAENQLRLTDPAVVDAYTTYLAAITAAYAG